MINLFYIYLKCDKYIRKNANCITYVFMQMIKTIMYVNYIRYTWHMNTLRISLNKIQNVIIDKITMDLAH